jgi:hypothetical protein
MARSSAVRASVGAEATNGGPSAERNSAQNQLAPRNEGVMALRAGDHGLVLQNFPDMWAFAQCVHRAGMAPKSLAKAEQVLVALQMGAELGLPPMQSLSNIAVVNGRPTVWGDLLVALVRRRPECEYINESWEGKGETRKCVCRAKRRGQPEIVREFGYQEAKVAGFLSKDTYKHFPDRMYQCRARSWAIRDLFADLLAGVVSTEEAQDEFIEDGTATLTSGDDAPLASLDQAAELLDQDEANTVEAEFEPYSGSPSHATPEEIAEWEAEKAAAQGQKDVLF